MVRSPSPAPARPTGRRPRCERGKAPGRAPIRPTGATCDSTSAAWPVRPSSRSPFDCSRPTRAPTARVSIGAEPKLVGGDPLGCHGPSVRRDSPCHGPRPAGGLQRHRAADIGRRGRWSRLVRGQVDGQQHRGIQHARSHGESSPARDRDGRLDTDTHAHRDGYAHRDTEPTPTPTARPRPDRDADRDADRDPDTATPTRDPDRDADRHTDADTTLRCHPDPVADAQVKSDSATTNYGIARFAADA